MTDGRRDSLRNCLHADEFGGGPVIDEPSIQTLRDLGGEDDPDLLAELIELYLTEAQDRVNILCDAQGGGDGETVARTAHSLKSSSANLGALAFSVLLEEIETMAADEGVDALESAVERCRGMFTEVEAALRRLKDAGPPKARSQPRKL